MSEMHPEPPPGLQPPAEPPISNEVISANSAKGSMALGFGLTWLIVVGGHVLMFAVSALLRSAAALFLPELVAITLGIIFAARGKTRFSAGMFIGLASVVGVALLLVAACFGLMSNGNFMR